MKIRCNKAILLAAGLTVLGAGSVVSAEGKIQQGVSINGTDVSGMSYAEAENVVKQKVTEALKSTITVQVGEDSVEATAVDFGLQWENRDIVEEAMELGNSGNLVKRYKEKKNLQKESQDLHIEFSTMDSAVETFVDEKCMKFQQEPKDASIYSDGGAGFVLEEGQVGQTINVEESIKILKDYMANEWQGASDTVAISVEVEKPKGNTEDLEKIQDKLGSYTTYYGSTYGRNTNVERGAELINNHVIWPGETFSVCDHLVPFSAENGYELGGAYSNGEVVQEYGGGICQVSTTLYNALLEAEIEIVERHNHTMSVSYVPTSMDAAIAEGSMDLVFRNNLDTPIFISGYGYGGELTFTVWGEETRPEDRYVSYQSETVSASETPTTVKFVTKSDQPAGYLSQTQSAMAGSSAVLYKYVTYNGETTVEQVNTSTYQSTPATYEVGVAGASQALLNAIASGSLEAVQQALNTAKETEKETEATTTETTETPETTAPETTAPETSAANDGYWTDSPDGEIWVEGGSADGVVSWE